MFIFHNFPCRRISFTLHTSTFANIESNGIGTTSRSCIEIEIHSNQEISGSHCSTSCLSSTLSPYLTSKIGHFIRITKTWFQAFVFAFTASSKFFTFRMNRSVFITIGRYTTLECNSFCKLSGIFSSLFHSNTRDRDKWQYISSSHTRMLTMMFSHIYHICSFQHTPKSSFHHSINLSHKSNNGTVGSFTRVNIKKFDALYTLYYISYLFDYIHIAPLTEIGHAFYYSFFHLCTKNKVYIFF